MITAVIIEHHNSLTYNTHVLHENIALIFKIHKTVRHCFNVCMRSLTLKYSASLGITSSRIILEQGALASPSLFKQKKVYEAIFSLERCARSSPDPPHCLISLCSLL